jgi:MFS family permease
MAALLDRRTAVAPLRSPAFRRYLLGQLPSVTGSWVQVVAVSWVVVQIDPQALGWVVALQFLPTLLLGPWLGAMVDRHDRRILLLLAEAGLGVVAFGYAVTAAASALTLPVVAGLAATWGVLNALDTPARRSLVPMLVPREAAASAAALTGTVLLLGMTLGTAFGGAVVASAGVAVAFGLNAASFLLDVVVVATLRVGPSPRVPRAPRQIRDGIGYVRRTPALRSALVTLAVIATFGFTVQVSVPVLAREGLGGGPGTLGALFTAVTAGGLLGTLLFAARGGSGPATLARCAGAMAIASLTTALAPGPVLAVVGLAGIGIAWSYLVGAVLAVLQTARPELTGRVMALFAAVLLSGLTVGGPLTTAVTGVAGPRGPFLLGAVAAALVGLALATVSRRSAPAAAAP